MNRIVIFILLLSTASAFSQNYPVAHNEEYTVNVGEEITIRPLDNDTDPLGEELKILYTSPNLGSYMDSVIMYTGNRSHVGTTVYTYYACRVNDEFAYSNPATITINVIGEPWEPPMAGDDYIEVPVHGYAYIDITENDYSEDGYYIRSVRNAEKYQNLGFAEVTSSKHLEFYAFGSPGVDSTYYYIEGKKSHVRDTAWIHFRVTEGQQQVYARDDEFEVVAGYPYTFEVLSNDTPTTANIVELKSATAGADFSIVENKIVCKPYCWFQGISSVQYVIEYQGLYDAGTIQVNIQENNNRPIAHPDIYTVKNHVSTQLNLLENDEFNTNVRISITQPNYLISDDIDIKNHDTYLSLTPLRALSAPLILKYKIIDSDNPNIFSAPTSVTIHFEDNENRPMAMADTIEIIDGDTTVVCGFLNNDIDPEGYSLTLNHVYGHAGSYAAGIAGYDSIVFVPVYENVFSSGSFSFTYDVKRVEQEKVISAPAMIYVNIIPKEGDPIAVADTVIMNEIKEYEINLLENDNFHGKNPINIEYRILNHFDLKIDSLEVKATPALGYTGWDKTSYYVTLDDGTKVAGSLCVYQENGSQQTDFLNINNINARFNSTGINFQHFDTPFYCTRVFNYDGYNFLCNSEKPVNALSQSTLWITGTSQDGFNHFSGDIIMVDFDAVRHDFQPGPVSLNYDNRFKTKYVRLWRINKGMIANHVNNYSNPDYEISEEILTWPGNGDSEYGEAEQLAPYYDKNENGIYEPFLGDYPLIRGDQAIFFILNDDIEHTHSYGMKMKAEVHAMAYAFENSEDETLNNTIFVHYDIYNRSDRTYYDSYVGMHSTAKLEDMGETLFGTDVGLTSNFFYNSSDNLSHSAISTTFLGGPFLDDDNIDNPTGGCDESITGSGFSDGIIDNERFGLMTSVNPFDINLAPYFMKEKRYIDKEYRYHMKAFGLDSEWKIEHLSYGGRGLKQTGAYGPECRYMYPWDSDPCNYGLDGETPNGPQDWRDQTSMGLSYGLGSCGPFTFEAGGKEELDIAYVYAYDPEDNDDTPSVELLKARIADLLQKRDNGEIYPYFITETGHEEYGINYQKAIIYPSPATDQITIKAKLSDKAEYRIYNSTGTCLLSGILMDGTLHPVNVNTLRPGIYILKIENETAMFTGKFVIGN